MVGGALACAGRSQSVALAAVGVVLATLAAIAYLVLEPSSVDLAAQTFRADLFESDGPLLWSNYWYGGHYLLTYSVLFPPLGALLGPRVVGAVAVVATAVFFAALARHRYGERAWLGTLWLGGATATMLLANRLTFALGAAIGLGALLAVQRGRHVLGGALAALSSLGSPVAGLFVAVAGGALAVTGRPRLGLALAAAALAPIALLGLAFPAGGYFPFVFTAFLPVPLFAAAAIVLLPAEERVLRAGVFIYAALCLVLFVFHTQVGANAARLGSLFGGPVLALGLAGRRPLALALVALPLLYWQWTAPVRDFAAAEGDRSVNAAYWEPLIGELERVTEGRPTRVEIPPTRNRWEADYLPPELSLARGWLRQSEADDFDLFTDGNLTATAYRAWLQDKGVSYVALADAEPDYLAEDEGALIRRGLPYLRPLWSNEHWRLYRVRGAAGLVSPADGPADRPARGARVAEIEASSFTLSARETDPYLVRFHWTPYWSVTRGDACVEGDGDWTRVDVERAGAVEVTARFSLDGLLRRDRECSG
jgi:hypothetical protein